MIKQGRNVWFDLMTTDTDAAKAFYTETLGWKTKDWEGDATMPYTMLTAGDTGIGGMMTLPEEAKKMGAPPHWLAYTAVDDVDAATEQAKKLGGKVYREPGDIPDVGRIAILADPQGATFAVYKAANDMSDAADGKGIGQFGWAELNTTDWEGAWKFYSQLFGWNERDKMDMGDAGIYFMWDDSEKITKGAMCNIAAQTKLPPHWLHYVNVNDLDGTVERIKSQGGKILNGPMDVPGGDRIAQCADPQGAAFAIYEEGKK